MYKPLYIIIVFTLLLTPWLGSCVADNAKEKPQNDPKVLKEPLINANRYLRETEDDLIEGFIERYGWSMQKTSSGLRYMVYEHGSGSSIEKDDTVQLEYELRLINGNIVYSSAKDRYLSFKQGSSAVEKGLNEAALLLKQGDRAKIIIPSHLAYGLPGDQNKIPARASLIYDVFVVKVTKD